LQHDFQFINEFVPSSNSPPLDAKLPPGLIFEPGQNIDDLWQSETWDASSGRVLDRWLERSTFQAGPYDIKNPIFSRRAGWISG
jgi:hypothetical protein